MTPLSALPSLRPCVFLDRDGSLVDDPGFLRDPVAVRLLPGAAGAVARLNAAGWPVVIVTNQSGIGREIITWEQYHAVARRVDQLLGAEGATILATYVCPHWLERDGPCGCRKPGRLHFEIAAREHGLDLARSWWVGDRVSDIEPARAWKAGGILLLTGKGRTFARETEPLGFHQAATLAEAVERILADGPQPA